MPYRDSDNEELDDEEYPDPEWSEESNGTHTSVCPRCGSIIYEQAERCPLCGWYISEEDSDPPPQRLWIIVGVVLALIVVIFFWIL